MLWGPSVIRSRLPATSRKRRRMGRGTTSRPAASMVIIVDGMMVTIGGGRRGASHTPAERSPFATPPSNQPSTAGPLAANQRPRVPSRHHRPRVSSPQPSTGGPLAPPLTAGPSRHHRPRVPSPQPSTEGPLAPTVDRGSASPQPSTASARSGPCAEEICSLTPAVDAYNDVCQRNSENQAARNALAGIQNDKKVVEVNRILPAHTRGEER
jgi:hypothetical protein